MPQARERLLEQIKALRQEFEARYHRPLNREEARILDLAEHLSQPQDGASLLLASELIESTRGELSLPDAPDSEPQ